METLKAMWEVAVPMFGGMKYTLGLMLITACLSIPLGFLLTLMRVSRIKPLSVICGFYVWVVRGTPLLLQLFFVFFGLPYLPFGIGEFFTFGRFEAACVTFCLNYAAYFCEIFRGGLLSIDKGQYEAAKVLGFSRWQTTFKIVIPQMIRVVLPSVCNECVNLVKDSALITAIGVTEILYFGRTAMQRLGNPMPYLVAGIIYLVINFFVIRIFEALEKKFSYEKG